MKTSSITNGTAPKSKRLRRLFLVACFVGTTAFAAPFANAQSIDSTSTEPVRVSREYIDHLESLPEDEREDEVNQLPRRARRKVFAYLACRFGPRGESRAVCLGEM